MKNQDLKIRELEKSMSEMVKERDASVRDMVKDEMDVLQEECHVKVKEALEREEESILKCRSLTLQLKASEAAREEVEKGICEDIEGARKLEDGWERQKDIFLRDIQRVEEELFAVKKERDQLRVREGSPEKLRRQDDEGIEKDGEEWMLEREAYVREIEEVRGRLEEVSEERRKAELESMNQKAALKGQLDEAASREAALSKDIELLKGRVAGMHSREDVEAMRKELKLLRKVNFSQEEEEEDDADSDTCADAECSAAEGGVASRVQDNLVGRLRKVQGDLIKAQREKSDLNSLLSKERGSLSTLEAENAKLSGLVETLEAEVLALQRAKGAGEGHESSAPVLQSILSTPDHKQPLSSPSFLSAQKQSPATSSFNEIVMSQRDRLQAKVSSLEMSRSALKRELSELETKVSSLTKANQILYDRVRYKNSNSLGSMPKLDELDDLEKGFELRHDPFSDFAKQEKKVSQYQFQNVLGHCLAHIWA